MFSYDHLLAVVLLTSPVETAEMAPHLDLVQPGLLRVAIQAEVLDPREDQFLEGLSKDPVGDCLALRSRYETLVNTPAIFECNRFPERKLIEEFLAFNRAYRKDLHGSLHVNPTHSEALRDAIQEVDRLHFVWSMLRDARCTFYYVTVRRQSLQQVHDLIGAEAFFRSQMPPHVPIRYFPYQR